ncbi:hypothetical protein DJ72_07470, partial [Halorubrum distributum]
MDAGLLFALAAAVVWGTYLFVLKRAFSEYPPAALTVAINAAALAEADREAGPREEPPERRG